MFVVPSCPAIFDTLKTKGKKQTTTINHLLVPTALMSMYVEVVMFDTTKCC